MMIRPDELKAIKAGEVDLAFRRWDRPRVKVGTRMRTSVGVLEVTEVERVSASKITGQDAKRAGARNLKSLKEALDRRTEVPIFKVTLRYAGEDPRKLLRNEVPTAGEIEGLIAWLDRLDKASAIGPWTRQTLDIIDHSPAVRAPDLAAQLGRDTPEFKRDVRKLKEKGLTESLDIGYRLSPRGIAVVDHGQATKRERPAPPTGTSLPRIGAPATRALHAAGITTLEQVAEAKEQDLTALHGVGPKAIGILQETLDEHGWTFA